MYSIAELATARQHDADVTWLIVDDGGYGILREYMTDAFGQATATELSRPDFAALAASSASPLTWRRSTPSARSSQAPSPPAARPWSSFPRFCACSPPPTSEEFHHGQAH
jgi:acetolactate synthase-1/2/3 large subunit